MFLTDTTVVNKVLLCLKSVLQNYLIKEKNSLKP